MRRMILGVSLGAILLAAAVGSAVNASQPRPAKMDAQCARFHMPRPFESPRATGYGQCAAWAEGALAPRR